MSRIVVDANVALDWMIPSLEGDAYSGKVAQLAVEGDLELIVPLHFDVEVARVLRKRMKNNPKQFPKSWYEASLKALDVADFSVVAQGINFELLGKLSDAYNLDVPDVPYLHLARTLEIPLATRDSGIVSACQRWNVLHWQP